MWATFDVSESDPVREALIRFNVAYRIRERQQVIPRPSDAINPRQATVLAVRNLREEASTGAKVIVAMQPQTAVTVYEFNPPKVANGYTWLFAELGNPVQYAGYVVKAIGADESFEYAPIVVEPPPEGIFSIWLTDNEVQQTIVLYTRVGAAEAQQAQLSTQQAEISTQISAAYAELATILTRAVERSRPTVLEPVTS